MLDTARLRQMLGQALQVEPRSVQAQVVGEHGDSEVVLWSSATIAGLPLAHFPGWSSTQEAPIQTAVRTAAYEIIRRKGATNHAIGWVTADLVRCILRNERRVLTVARRIDGACGLQDVALSLPMIVGATGAEQILEPHLSPTEAELLKHSAAVLRQAYQPLLTPSERA
jgi:L-lactate dehydrogenase